MKYSVQISVKEFPWDAEPAERKTFYVEAESAEQAMELFLNRIEQLEHETI